MIKPLSPKVITKAFNLGVRHKDGTYPLEAIAQEAHQNCLRQVVEWGDEPCSNSKHSSPILQKKRNCSDCWRELRNKMKEDK